MNLPTSTYILLEGYDIKRISAIKNYSEVFCNFIIFYDYGLLLNMNILLEFRTARQGSSLHFHLQHFWDGFLGKWWFMILVSWGMDGQQSLGNEKRVLKILAAIKEKNLRGFKHEIIFKVK